MQVQRNLEMPIKFENKNANTTSVKKIKMQIKIEN